MRGLRGQTERAFEHIGEILDAAGGDFNNILKITIYMTDIREKISSTELRRFTSIRKIFRRVAWWRCQPLLI